MACSAYLFASDGHIFVHMQLRRVRIVCSRGAGPIFCTPSGDRINLLYAYRNRVRHAYYLPHVRAGTGLESINQSINHEALLLWQCRPALLTQVQQPAAREHASTEMDTQQQHIERRV